MENTYRDLENEIRVVRDENDALKSMGLNSLKPFYEYQNRKLYFEGSERMKAYHNKHIKDFLKETEKHLHQFGLKYGDVNINELCNSNEMKVDIKRTDIISQEDLISARTLSFKDKNLISDKLYHGIAKHFKIKKYKYPTLYNVKRLRKQTDAWTKNFKNQYGVYVDAKAKLFRILNEMGETKTGKHTLRNLKMRRVRIKLTGDSGNVGRYLKLLNFTFAAIDFQGSQSFTGNYTLGIFEMKEESYDELKVGLKEILLSLENVNSIEINGKMYKIEFYLGGDLKFLANMMGINGANANYPCVSCTCHLKDFPHFQTKAWSIKDTHLGARSLEESLNCCGKKSIDERKGYLREPIIKFIKNEKIIVDLLHVCLRISDKLFEHLLRDIETLDGEFKVDINENINFCVLVKFLQNECKLKNPYFIKDGKVTLKSWDVQKRLLVLSKINLADLFPQLEDNHLKTKLLYDFYTIHTLIRDNLLNSLEISYATKKFMKDYVNFYPLKSITPYLHYFSSHLSEFRKLHGDFNVFNQQGLEKLNDVTTKQTMRSTNHHHDDYLNQLLKKRNRLDHFK